MASEKSKRPQRSTILPPRSYEIFDVLYMARDGIRSGEDPIAELNAAGDKQAHYGAFNAIDAEMTGPFDWKDSAKILRALDRALQKEETAIAAAEAHELLMREIGRANDLGELPLAASSWLYSIKQLCRDYVEISGRVR